MVKIIQMNVNKNKELITCDLVRKSSVLDPAFHLTILQHNTFVHSHNTLVSSIQQRNQLYQKNITDTAIQNPE